MYGYIKYLCTSLVNSQTSVYSAYILLYNHIHCEQWSWNILKLYKQQQQQQQQQQHLFDGMLLALQIQHEYDIWNKHEHLRKQ